MAAQSNHHRARLLPPWQINLLLFGLLTVLTLAAFLWQLGRINTSFRQHSLEHSRMVAGVIQQNLQNAMLSQQTINEILSTFLGNSARFIAYLEQIESFNSEELTALALKAGLAGIIIFHNSKQYISGPASWFPLPLSQVKVDGSIQHLRNNHLIFMAIPLNFGNKKHDFIIVGFNSDRIEILQEKTGLDALLTALSNLPGINYVHLKRWNDEQNNGKVTVNFINHNDQLTAETRLALDIGQLTVGLDARQYILRVADLRGQFVIFACLFGLLGLFFSWLLHRLQKADLERTRNFERMMARQHEAAALGRATAAIAHEIRNPLNAIYMGLQRLTIESDNLEQEQRDLLDAMGEAVKRTSRTIRELQRYTKPLTPELKPVNLAQLLNQAIALYQPMIKKQQIKIIKKIDFYKPIYVDPGLLAEVIDNLLKNSIEAQPETGFIEIRLEQKNSQIILTVINGGCHLDKDEISRLGEPYFTTKTKGSGLGLAVSRKIIEAHKGKLSVESDNDTLIVKIIVSAP